LQIVLPDDVKSVAEREVAAGRYASLSEYVAELIRRDQQRTQGDQLTSLLRDRLAAGPSVPMTSADFDAIRQRLDERAAQRRGR
jgi:antitoxin ParD1/3/4